MDLKKGAGQGYSILCGQGFWERNFVWHSSDASIEANKVSVLACFELVFSISLFWWAAWFFETYVHLWLSILVAPMLLLKSQKSVTNGVKFAKLFFRTNEKGHYLTKVNEMVERRSIIFAIVGAYFTFVWIKSGSGLFSTITALVVSGVIGFNLLMSGVSAGSGRGSHYVETICSAFAIGSLVYLIWFVSNGPIDYIHISLILLLITLVGQWALPKRSFIKFNMDTIAGWLFLSTTFGPTWGFMSRIWLIRTFATSMSPVQGIVTLPNNWRTLIFSIDLKSTPVLLPDPHKESGLWSFKDLERGIGSYRRGDWKNLNSVNSSMVPLFLILPSMVYRYSIKSTCWLYLPILYMIWIFPKNKLKWIIGTAYEATTIFRVLIASLTLLLAGIALVDSERLAVFLKATQLEDLPFNALSILFVLDWSLIRPWHWFTIPSSILTILLFFWMGHISSHGKAGVDFSTSWQIPVIIFTNTFRSILATMWILISLYHTLGFFLATCTLFPWMEWVMTFHYSVPSCV